ncbi:MAG: Na(+)-translocating NADH-quinone reductase subunit A [Bacteroidales bacterium]|nr:Na(+)-translocating NADH-quinone reductase subunit A [Bacteroidales bacterium]
MSQNFVLKKGLNIPVSGEAALHVSKTIAPGIVAVQPTDFKGFLPRLLVKEGDPVLCGSPVMADKKNADILLTSPVSGTVKEIVRGDKRKLLAVLIEADAKQQCVDFGVKDASKLDADQVRQALLQSGLWPWLIQRPYGILANPDVRPRDIFISTFSTAPLAADSNFCFGSELQAAQAGVCALSKLTDGKVHVSLDGNGGSSAFAALQHCELHTFQGKHPAGNVGVQISHIAPICKEDIVWTVSPVALIAIGKLFTTGRLDVRRKVAVTGPMAIEPAYIETVPGMPMKEISFFCGNTPADTMRIISGDVLTGKAVGENGYLGTFDNQVSLLHEGTEEELLGWLNPVRAHQFSADHSYFSWLTPKKKYAMDTNLHGGPRAFLMNDGYYARVLPMDIYPVYLAKACLAGEIEKMEKFGIYEVLPEDLATCEFVDPSKNNIQEMIEQGIDLMLKEMA